MTRAIALTLLLCLTAFAADEAMIAPQAATDPHPQARISGAEAVTIPQMLSYQGKLTDSLGVPVGDTAYSVTFRLYDVPTGGSPFWSETQPVRTKTGLFSVLLGSVTPIDSMPASGAAYIGMAIEGGSELTPRLQIASAAYSYLTAMAANSDRLQGKDTSGLDIRYVNEGQANSVTSAMLVNGTVAAVDLNQMGAASGQVLKWTGSTWAPGNDSVGNGGGGGTVRTVAQATGVVCSPNPITDSGTVRFDTTWGDARFVNEGQANSLTGAMIVDGGVSSADIRDTTVNATDLKDAAVTMAKINQAGATTGQVVKWTGSAWAPRNDSVGSGTGDNAWIRSGSDSVLYTVHPLGLAMAGNVLLGSAKYTHVNFGVACTTGSAANEAYATVSGGRGNRVSAFCGTIGGGDGNLVTAENGVVAGGEDNQATGVEAGVLAGVRNWATGDDAVVGGGDNNHAHGECGVVGGGGGNDAANDYSVIGGGEMNDALGYYNTIGGGGANYVDGECGTIGGGTGNAVTGYGAAVAGGEDNEVSADDAVVAGGYNNSISDSAWQAIIGGGNGNHASVEGAFIGGGLDNTIDSMGQFAAIAGGEGNHACSDHAAIGGGDANQASGADAAIGGGAGNVASGDASAIVGGDYNVASGDDATVAGGGENLASGAYSSVAGGWADSSAGDYSFTVGNLSNVPSGYANSAAFNGQVATASNQTRVGVLSKASGTFTIDHPLDPQGKILNHYFVEGPEMRNIYDGEAVLDASGRAVVSLPDYFDALNRTPRIQLTGVGSSDVYVAEKETGNRFVIGGKPGTEVFWQVTGERKDMSAEATRRMMPVEQPKTGVLAGRMLDDDFLAGCMSQLVREGKVHGIDFRTAAGRQRYENARQVRTPGRPDHARAKATDRRLAAEQRRAERKRLSAERRAARGPERKAERKEGGRKSDIPVLR